MVLQASPGGFPDDKLMLIDVAHYIICMCSLRNLPQMLDCMAVGGGMGIAVGRLASLFNASDRGMVLPDSVGLPFAFPVTNAVSGAVENRLATFMLQSIFAAAIVILLLLY